MSDLVREKRAVNEHPCPKCHAQAGFRCIRNNASVRIQRASHPHAERIALLDRDSRPDSPARFDVR